MNKLNDRISAEWSKDGDLHTCNVGIKFTISHSLSSEVIKASGLDIADFKKDIEIKMKKKIIESMKELIS